MTEGLPVRIFGQTIFGFFSPKNVAELCGGISDFGRHQFAFLARSGQPSIGQGLACVGS
jgi:hypothetical protein